MLAFKQPNRSDLLFQDSKDPDRIWNPNKLTQQLNLQTEYFLDARLGLADWRHVAIAVGRKYSKINKKPKPNLPANS